MRLGDEGGNPRGALAEIQRVTVGVSWGSGRVTGSHRDELSVGEGSACVVDAVAKGGRSGSVREQKRGAGLLAELVSDSCSGDKLNFCEQWIT